MKTQAVLAGLIISICLSSMPSFAAPTPMHDTSRHLYDRVMQEFKQRDYEAALAGFRLFLELHGQSALAANAHYWMGECQYRLRRYSEALTSFYNVLSYYPLSHKMAASTLKLGQIYSRLDDHEKARLMFDRVVDEYPDTSEAQLARKALEILAVKSDQTPLRPEIPIQP
jgi:tol-pal system protein YbgF